MTLRGSIFATLAYSAYFSYPLTFPELFHRLIGFRIDPDKLKRTLAGYVSRNLISKKGKYYFLLGREDLVSARVERAVLSGDSRRHAKRYSNRLSKIPGVLAIYLTGSLAMMNSGIGDDIDYMIVTRNGRLWTSRFLMTLYCSVMGIRRTPLARSFAGKICLNLYLSPVAFTLPPSKRSLYTAYELTQAIPLYDPGNTHLALLRANGWIREFIPNFEFPKVGRREVPTSENMNAVGRSDLLRKSWPKAKMFSQILSLLKERPGQTLMDFIENLAYRLQVAYMKKRMTREYVTPDSAYFHPDNPGESVLSRISRH